MIHTDTVHALTSIPATDINFVSCLKSATNLQIEMAVKPQIISGDFRRLYKVEIPVTVCG